jgi:hypothetical protein
MKIYIRIILLFLLSIGIGNVNAQDAFTNYKTAMNTIFANVDHSQVTTGLLSDYGLQLIPPNYYDGTLIDSNDVDVPTFQKLYAGMDYSRFNSIFTLPSLTAVEATIAANMPTAGQAIPVTIMNISYNHLLANAATSGLVTISNGQIYNVAGKNPYETKTLFAATPLVNTIKSASIQFILKSSLYFNSNPVALSSIQFDAGDGNGFRTVSWNTAFSVIYPSTGTKTYIVKMTFSTGIVLLSHGKVNVSFNSSLKSNSSYSYSYSASQSFSATSNHSGGNVTVMYGSGHSQITKPLIIAEGYDPWKIMSPDQPCSNLTIDNFLDIPTNCNAGNIYQYIQQGYNYYSIPTGTINVPISSGGTLRDYLYTQGYDIIYVDNNNGTDDIVRNANLLEQVIAWVNANKSGTQPNVIMGISMGGLVARYALCDMERNGINHQTKVYISMDTPHNGANAPIGAQAALCSIKDVNAALGLSDMITQSVTLLNAPATQQMLIYKVSKSNGSLVASDNSGNSFMTTLHGMGLPKYCYNVAISDGAGDASIYFNPGTTLINYSKNFSKWWEELLMTMSNPFFTGFTLKNLLPGASELKIDCNINAIPSTAGQVYSTRVYVKKQVLGIFPTTSDIINLNCNSISGMAPIDGTAGGNYDLGYFGTVPVEMSDYVKQQRFCFIPATSAIALSDWKTPIINKTPLNNTNYIGNGQTNFQEYYVAPSNNIHTMFHTSDYSLANFIKTKLDNINSYCTSWETINTTYTTSQRVNKCNVTLQNLSVQNNSTVTFDVSGSVHVNELHVQQGSSIVNLK